jgi:hypothetical protein
MRDAREDPKTQVVAVRRNPTKTSTAWCVGVRYTNVNQSRLAEVMTDDAYYKAKKNLIKGLTKPRTYVIITM